MALSRKQKRELSRLRGQAEQLWDDQKDVLDRANQVIRDASHHARIYAREEVAPRARATFDERVKPTVAAGLATGLATTGRVASSARGRLVDDVIPGVASAYGSALAVLEAAKDPAVRAALGRVTAAGNTAASKVGIVKPKPAPGPGRYILIGLGIVAAVGVAYAAWQTLRADDDLWIDDEEATEQTGEVQPS